jgi:hypothetical protein
MSDKLVFDLAQEVEGSPNVFIRKDWLNILDNQNQNYNNNQSIVDTSQLSNSNKYMSYREAYFLIPLLMTVESTLGSDTFLEAQAWKPASKANDYAVGLKNWFGQIIHSFTLDYNGTTIIQQTPYVNMWNSFKLMTSLSYDDICTQGATIGFYPDDPTSWTWTTAPDDTAASYKLTANSANGQGVANNSNALQSVVLKNVASQFGQYNSGAGNRGFAKRQSYIAFDVVTGKDAGGGDVVFTATNYPTTYNEFMSSSNCSELWKSYILRKQDGGLQANKGLLQINVVATVYLKHVHSFFNMCPLLKGVFMKMTMNLNNSTTSFVAGYGSAAGDGTGIAIPFVACTGVSVPIGGVNVGLIASAASTDVYNITDIGSAGTSTINAVSTGANTFSMTGSSGINITGGTITVPNPPTGANGAFATGVNTATVTTLSTSAPLTSISGATGGSISAGTGVAIGITNATINLGAASAKGSVPNGGYNLLPATATIGHFNTFRFNISVGARCLDSSISSSVSNGATALSIYLYIPAYTFNPVFEQAYLSSPVKQIKYTDIYQYQVLNVSPTGQFNNLLTNGIANIKSVLILPFLSSASGATGISPAGSGFTTAKPYCAGSTSVQLSKNSGFIAGLPVWQSPFDPVGTGATSPLSLFKNFNIQVSGQNAIYNLEKYAFEQFNNQLYGQNAVNGGLTDGLTSGLVDRLGFDMEYCYYYVNVERMLPVEMTVPKSIQILGQPSGLKAVDLYCFVEYGVEISIDALTGARV